MTASAANRSAAELLELESLAIAVAQEAADFVAAGRAGHLGIQSKSTLTDLVTDMDAASEQLLRERLLAARPDDGFFGEEGGGTPARGDITWVVDPIDGTVNYVYGDPNYVVSVAAVVGDPHEFGGWAPLAGAVAHPATGQVYHARRGAGAFVRGRTGAPTRLQVTGAQSLELSLLGTGFGYRREQRHRQAQELVEILPQVRDIRRGGSAALDLCSVAGGRLDAYYERGVNPWDIAGGWIIVSEAGGRVTGVTSPRPDSGGMIASAPGVHDRLLAVVREATRT